MTELLQLRGLTWDHNRGFDPLVATSRRYCELNPSVEITWETCSLETMLYRPVSELTDKYDLLVIEHPHVGEISANGSLLALDQVGRDDELQSLSRQSVGPSHSAYQFDDHQWGLVIDASTQVAAYRPDSLSEAPKCWSDVEELASDGQVAFALNPFYALMTFLGWAKNLGMPIAEDPSRFIASDDGAEILVEMLNIATSMDPRCIELDQRGILEWIGRNKDAPAYSPSGYGDTNYSRKGYCPYPLVFTDAPGIRDNGPGGAVFGGAGIAVSSQSRHKDAAIDYSFWIAGAECQSGLFFESGGQPGNATAWESESCNAACSDFFTNTRETQETSWVRPRYNGYLGFQIESGNIIHACLSGDATISDTLASLEKAYRMSWKNGAPSAFFGYSPSRSIH